MLAWAARLGSPGLVVLLPLSCPPVASSSITYSTSQPRLSGSSPAFLRGPQGQRPVLSAMEGEALGLNPASPYLGPHPEDYSKRRVRCCKMCCVPCPEANATEGEDRASLVTHPPPSCPSLPALPAWKTVRAPAFPSEPTPRLPTSTPGTYAGLGGCRPSGSS